jgi:hypothetical protein
LRDDSRIDPIVVLTLRQFVRIAVPSIGHEDTPRFSAPVLYDIADGDGSAAQGLQLSEQLDTGRVLFCLRINPQRSAGKA